MEKGTAGYTLSVVGGDERAIFAARYLSKRGCTCRLFHLGEGQNPCAKGFEKGRCQAPYGLADAFLSADLALLPLPLTRDGVHLNAPFSESPPALEGLFSRIPSGLALVGGGLDRPFFKNREGLTADLLKDDGFARENALPTAEGALGLALLSHKGVLSESRCGILGYGRIGQALLPRLLALGAQVTVFARREASLEDARRAGADGMPFELLEEGLPFFDLLFNTVPTPLLTPRHCALLPEDALYIELASHPYGLFDGGRQILAARHLSAPGLPGRYAPAYAGALIGKRVLALLEGKGTG